MNIKAAKELKDCFINMITNRLLSDNDLSQIAAILFRRLKELQAGDKIE